MLPFVERPQRWGGEAVGVVRTMSPSVRLAVVPLCLGGRKMLFDFHISISSCLTVSWIHWWDKAVDIDNAINCVPKLENSKRCVVGADCAMACTCYNAHLHKSRLCLRLTGFIGVSAKAQWASVQKAAQKKNGATGYVKSNRHYVTV